MIFVDIFGVTTKRDYFSRSFLESSFFGQDTDWEYVWGMLKVQVF